METSPNRVLETQNYNPYDVLETEGQNLITKGDEVVIIEGDDESGGVLRPFDFKNYNISFEEEYLSSDNSVNKNYNSQYTKMDGDNDFITQEKLKTWGGLSSERKGLLELGNSKYPSSHKFAYHGVQPDEVYNKIFDKMIRDNIQQLHKENRDSFLEYYDSENMDNSSTFTSSLDYSSKVLLSDIREDSDVRHINISI